MGLVFLAEDPSLNRQVAIKMLDFAADSDTDREFMRTRLLRDARAAAILSHPNVVAVYDIVEDAQSVYVVMEYIQGESLSAFLDHTTMPDCTFTLQVLRQIAAGLDYTHSKGVIHRDIKPGNVMISPDGGVKILDFGIARMTDTRTSTPTGVVMGTVDYMAPEQIKAAQIDGRADQFSLAAVAYRMMTGSTLFGRHTLATLAYKLIHEAPPSACERNTAIPAAVDEVLSKALAKTPADRYPTCSAFVDDLGRALSGTATSVAAVATPTSTMAVQASRPEQATPIKRSKSTALLAAGALVAAAAAGVAIWKPWRQPAPLVSQSLPIVEPPPPAAAKPPESTTRSPEARAPNVPPVIKPKPAPAKTEVAPTKATGPSAEQLEARDTPFHRGLEELKAKDFGSAIRTFTEVLRRRPRMAMAYYNRGIAYQMSGQFEKAVSDYSDAIRLGLREPRAYSSLGVCQARMHQDDRALEDFNHALELDANYAAALNGRGGVFSRRRQYRLAIRDFTAAIKSNPELVMAYENRANARLELGDKAGAESDLAAVKRLQKR